MRYITLILALAILDLVLCATPHTPLAQTADQKSTTSLTLIGTIALPGVEGRLDHLAADADTHRLFVAALENRSVEEVDLDQARRLRSLTGVNEPQGLLYLAPLKLLLACSGGDGTCRSFDSETFKEGPRADLGRNADNMRFDARAGLVFVGSGGEPGPGTLTALSVQNFLPLGKGGQPALRRSTADLASDQQPSRIAPRAEVALPSHPESFQLSPDGRRVFVNLPDDHAIGVVDVTTQGLKLAATWPVTAGEMNFPMAVDPQVPRLYVACRQPARLVCYDTRSGKELARADCVGDADDLFYDPETQRLYVIGGDGFVDVFSVTSVEQRLTRLSLTRLARVPTRPKARTGLFIPRLHLLCVAAPHASGHEAAILLYRVVNASQGE